MPSNPLFSEICEIVDCEHKNPPFEVSGHPYVRTSDIGRGRISFDNVKWISEDSYEKWTRRATPQPGDLILTRDPPIGNVGIVEDGMKVCLGQGTVLLRPNRSVIDSLFLTYLIL
ncbi:MAG: restriction endonuclease subunit S, partial [Thermoplasmata archaeon]